MAGSTGWTAIAFISDRGGSADIWILSVSEASVDY